MSNETAAAYPKIVKISCISGIVMIHRLYTGEGLLINFSLFAACISHSDTMGASPQGGGFWDS